MSEIKLISPILDDFDIGGSISEHDGVRCFPAMRKETTDRYIIKTVSIPASQTQLEALLLTGAYPDAASALSYFKTLADATVEELEALRELAKLEGFLSYEDWQVAAKDDTVGFDVCMLGTYKYSLRKFMQHRPMTHLAAVNLGLDICAALATCRRAGYLYVDLKPNNIYVVDEQSFRIGDLGLIRFDSLKYATLPSKYRSQYTAPEVLDAFAPLNTTLDIYAMGLILYQAYNGGELPFNDQNAPDCKFDPPAYADYEMAEIILKACDPNPEARWQDPAEMGQALVSYMQRNGANNTPIVPPVIHLEEETETDLSDEDVSNEENVTLDAVPSDEISSDESELIDDTSIPNDAVEEQQECDTTEQEPDDEQLNIAQLLEEIQDDETVPENNIDDVSYDEISIDLSEILSQADELVAYPVPEPVVAPEDYTLPDVEEVTVLETPAEEVIDDNLEVKLPDYVQTVEDVAENSVNHEDTVVILPITPDEEQKEDSESTEDHTVEEANDAENIEEEIIDEPKEMRKPSRKSKVLNWILGIVIFLLIAAIVAVGGLY